ncbi:MAG TPA: glycoside hydrolase family 3 N-terminal domain-containing protein, partial [Limnochordia bacterium]
MPRKLRNAGAAGVALLIAAGVWFGLAGVSPKAGGLAPSSPKAEGVSRVDERLARMTLEAKIGQLVMAGFPGTVVNDAARRLIETGRVGGVILMSRNVESPAQLARLTADLQKLAKGSGAGVPLLIGMDQETG